MVSTCIHCKQEFSTEIIVSDKPERYRMRRCPHCQEITPIKTLFIGNDGKLLKVVFDIKYDRRSVPEIVNATKEFIKSNGEDIHTYKYKIAGIKGFDGVRLIQRIKQAKFSDLVSVLTLLIAIFEAPTYFSHNPTIENNYYYNVPARPESDFSDYKKNRNVKPNVSGPPHPDTPKKVTPHLSKKIGAQLNKPLIKTFIHTDNDFNELYDLRHVRHYFFEKSPLNKNEIVIKANKTEPLSSKFALFSTDRSTIQNEWAITTDTMVPFYLRDKKKDQ